MTGKITYTTWMQQPLISAERCRGRSLVWTPGAQWFINDPLGPVPHAHDDATEIAFMAQGQLEIEIGGSKRIYGAGDFILVPPDKYHNYWFSGVDPVCLFVVVAPNHKYRRWRTRDFAPEMHQGDAQFVNLFQTDNLPSDQHFQCERLTLATGESKEPQVFELNDRVIYVLSGEAHLKVGTLSGPLPPHQYQYIPATTWHQIGNPGYEPLVYLSLIVTDPDTAHGTEARG